jgi:site-specific DNA recombinase
MTAMRAVIYCRVSTTEQAQSLSLPTQEKHCREYCRREGWEVAKVFVDPGESAKSLDRPELRELLDYCRRQKKRVHFVVIYSLSRLSRNASDHLAIRGLLAGYGISLRSFTERIDDSPSGRFMETVIAATAQLDNDVRADRTTTGMKEAVSRGRFVWKAPLGYVNSADRHLPSLRIDPTVGPLVRRAFELCDSGLERPRLLATLAALGLTSRRGRPLTAQSLHHLLKNPVYVGAVRVPRWNIECQGDFEAIVSESLFLRVQARLSRNVPSIKHREMDDPALPLRRFVKCGACGTSLTGSWSRGRSDKYPYYRCRNGCSGVAARADVLEEQFLRLLDSMRPRPEYLRLFNAIVNDCWRAKQTDVEKLRSDLEQRVGGIRVKLQRVEDAYAVEERIDRRSYTETRDRLREDLALAELQLSEARNEQVDIEGVLAFAEHVISNASALWTSASPRDRCTLQASLFPHGLSYGPDGFGTVVTSNAFSYIREIFEARNALASPTGTQRGCSVDFRRTLTAA